MANKRMERLDELKQMGWLGARTIIESLADSEMSEGIKPKLQPEAIIFAIANGAMEAALSFQLIGVGCEEASDMMKVKKDIDKMIREFGITKGVLPNDE